MTLFKLATAEMPYYHNTAATENPDHFRTHAQWKIQFFHFFLSTDAHFF